MKFLLDANAVIGFLKGNDALWSRISQQEVSDVLIPSIVVHELYYGAHKSHRVQANLDKISGLPFESLPFDEGDARRAGEIRAALERAGTPIGPYDTMIAGQASARDLVLVTNNIREFQRVKDLRIEDWQV
jgi:tRNA(fMet)-specific endonuclease VapC